MISTVDNMKEDTKSLLQAVLKADNHTFLAEKSSQDLLSAMHMLFRSSKELDIPELSAKAQALASNAVKANTLHSTVILKAAESYTELGLDSKKLAVENIRSDPKLLLKKEQLELVSRSMMETILKDKNSVADDDDDFTWLKILDSWCEVDEENISYASSLVAKYISLERLDSNELARLENSRIVTKDLLYEAFKAKALMLNDKKDPSKKKTTSSLDGCQWLGETTNIVQGSGQYQKTHVMDCDWLQPGGVYQWRIKVENCEDEFLKGEVGVVANVKDMDCNTFLGNQTGGWALDGYNGIRYDNRSKSRDLSIKFQDDCTITLVLDLTGDGTLSASVDDGGASHLFFSDMISKARSLGASPEFRPAVSLYYSSETIRFLGFE